MLLTFKRNFQTGQPTNFKNKIQNGGKIHTIRKPSARFKLGAKIHFWENNPRNTTQNPQPFFLDPTRYAGKNVPHWVFEEKEETGADYAAFLPCICAIEEILLDFDNGYDDDAGLFDFVTVGGRKLTGREIDTLAANDGFRSSYHFAKFFVNQSIGNPLLNLVLIHWTLTSVYNEETAQISPEAKAARKIQF